VRQLEEPPRLCVKLQFASRYQIRGAVSACLENSDVQPIRSSTDHSTRSSLCTQKPVHVETYMDWDVIHTQTCTCSRLYLPAWQYPQVTATTTNDTEVETRDINKYGKAMVSHTPREQNEMPQMRVANQKCLV
jgi:hypothetical protein